MHPYTVKNWLWVVIISLFIVIALLSGCSSAPKQTTSRQYCYTSQEIRNKDGNTVSSETLVKCNDDPVEQIVIKKAGIAQNCGEYVYYITLNGNLVEQRALACKKFNGSWEVVNR